MALFVVIGDSGSGKTTLIAELVRNYPHLFKKVVTCTDRPMRDGEIDGEDYHFLPTEFFTEHANDLVLAKNTYQGNYGTRRSDLSSETHHLLLSSRVSGIPKLLIIGITDIVVIHIEISEELKIERMKERGDTNEMISDRLLTDAKTIQDTSGLTVPVIKLSAADSLAENVLKVIKAC